MACYSTTCNAMLIKSTLYTFLMLNVFFSVQDFHQMCDETRSWIGEKDQALSTDDCGRDLTSVQALQRRHQVRWQWNWEGVLGWGGGGGRGRT